MVLVSFVAPILVDEDDWESAQLKQKSVVCAAKSDHAKAKAITKRTSDVEVDSPDAPSISAIPTAIMQVLAAVPKYRIEFKVL